MKCECGERYYVTTCRFVKRHGLELKVRYYACSNGHKLKTYELGHKDFDKLLVVDDTELRKLEASHKLELEELRERVIGVL